MFGAHRNLTSAYARHRSAHARDADGRGGGGGAGRSSSGAGGDSFRSREGTSRLLDAALGPMSDDVEAATTVGMRMYDGANARSPAWVERCDEAARDVARIRENLRALGDAHAKALLPNFDDVGGEELVAEALTKEVTKLFKRCDVAIRAVSGTNGGDGEERVRVNAQRKLAMELNKLSQDFRRMQKDYLAKLKSQQDRGPGAAGLDSYAQFRSGSAEGANAGGGDLMRMEMLNRAETVSIERDREVMKILESVQDLGAVMKDLSALIIDQGTILDRIDYNCQTVATAVEEGRKELVQAEKSQKQSVAIMCIYILLVMVVFMTLLVVVMKS
jgi:syntaxin 16